MPPVAPRKPARDCHRARGSGVPSDPMAGIGDQWAALWPALAFLLAGVPLAALLDRLGFFEAAAARIVGRGGDRPVLALWVFAALTTVVLNLDTTVVLLTPLYLRLARRAGVDPLPLVAVPLLLASLASSVLPVSNLTNLIVVEQTHAGVGEFVTHVALPSVVAAMVGWLAYRRRHPTRLALAAGPAPDPIALRRGGLVVAALLVGFVAGPTVGIAPWVVALFADVALIAMTRTVPWRAVPLATAAGVAALGLVVAVIAPTDALHRLVAHDQPLAVVGIAGLGGAVANVVNNLPALLAVSDGLRHMSWGAWAWLLGVNTAAVLLPVGALANLLWLRLLRAEGVRVGVVRYLRTTVPVALPAVIAAVATLALERVIAG